MGNSATEYLFFRGTDIPTVMPWNIIEGLAWEPAHGGEWMVAAEDPGTGLFDESYSCQRCHMLGSTVPGTGVVPNPAASVDPSTSTARQWARLESDTVEGAVSDASVSMAGLGIQCEQCHGTGQADAVDGHANTGVVVSSGLETLGNSQVCGQCHGSYTNQPGTMGIYGYTTNLAMRDFVDVNGVSSGERTPEDPDRGRVRRQPGGVLDVPQREQCQGQPLLLRRVGRVRAFLSVAG